LAKQREDWFRDVCERTAIMVAQWMRVGFVHGVMNTDNMSILGLAMDYGPYGWLDYFDPDCTPNTTEATGCRYRFGPQPQIAFWNRTRLAGALLPLVRVEEPLQNGVQRFVEVFIATDRANAAAKLGLSAFEDDDVDLLQTLYALLTDPEVDMTIFFRAL